MQNIAISRTVSLINKNIKPHTPDRSLRQRVTNQHMYTVSAVGGSPSTDKILSCIIITLCTKSPAKIFVEKRA